MALPSPAHRPRPAATTILVALSLALSLLGLTRPAAAFCGFYVAGGDAKLFNNATMVVMMRGGTRTVLAMQNNYQGPPSDFAMVVPVPVVLQKENVKTLAREVFDHVDKAAAPRLVEYWEQDPCANLDNKEGGTGVRYRALSAPGAAHRGEGDLGVRVEAEFTVGEYEVVILSAEDALGLDTWLRQQRYNIPAGADELLRPYVASGMKFFVAKVNASKVTFVKGQAQLSPLRFHYDSDTFTLPIRLGLVNSAGTQDLIVHILAKDQRYEVANYPNVTIPTNLDVAEAARDQFGAFYAALFDRTVEQSPGAVVTEYAWSAGSCDPCPGPTLTPAELLSLGADVMPVQGVGMDRRPGQMAWAQTSGLVLTRLHARYGKSALGDDLVFRAAAPIQGGREVRPTYAIGPGGPLEHGASQARINNFQGRYAIRHPYTGPITCDHPTRGVWGGPPGGGQAAPRAAQDLAFAPRGGTTLASFLRSDVPELKITAAAAPLPGSAEPTGMDVALRVGLVAVALLVGLAFVLSQRKRSAPPTGRG